VKFHVNKGNYFTTSITTVYGQLK